MRITSVQSTYCFVADGERLFQVVRVVVADAPPSEDVEVSITVNGRGPARSWRGRLDPALAGQPGGPAWAPREDPGLHLASGFSTGGPPLPEGVVVEVAALAVGERPAGSTVSVAVVATAGTERAALEVEVVVRQPGWCMMMVPHFHYDPVWWNTQAGYTSGWDELLWALDRRERFQHTGLVLVEAHLQRARSDGGYKFVLAEVDYLKPFWDLYPDRREEIRSLLREGRLEVVGGTYNEPNTNLTGAETAIRVAVYGIGFQRDVVGADPRTAWQLDVFGHDPQFPGIMADCGLDSSAWARGPFHQWGPVPETGSTGWMQFPSEFEWVAPNGRSLLTSYMPVHYSAGWDFERATTVEGAMWRAYELFESLAQVAAVPVTLLPVGTDYTPPSRWVGEIASAWGRRYAWPSFEMGVPRDFFAAVRQELKAQGRAPSPQSRDMNPIYTGKDVSFIDTKQAQRLAEVELAEAEAMAVLASLLGAPPAYRALDKAWRQLVFAAHHDGITGSESDQVYLDLLGSWREAYELARAVAAAARQVLVDAIGTGGEGEALIVTNATGLARHDLVEVDVPHGAGGDEVVVLDDAGRALPVVCEPASGAGGVTHLQLVAEAVPPVGYRTYRLVRRPGSAPGSTWAPAPGLTIANEQLEVAADPEQGGGLTLVRERASGLDVVPPGAVGNELLVYREYPDHPRFGEGPWHLLPTGPPSRSAGRPARVRRETSALGERLIAEGELEGFAYRQTTTLYHGLPRLELRTEIHGWDLADRLLRLRFPTSLVGGTPISAVGDAVIGRGFALIEDVDSATAPWTLDNPAAEWFGLGANLVVGAVEGGSAYHQRSVGVAELITPPGCGAAPWARDLVVSLVQQGVTATCSEAGANRYGALVGDSNLPDFRFAVGGPAENAFVASLLDNCAPAYRAEFEDQLSRQGWACLLVPAVKPLSEVWRPGADLRGARSLPVLVVAGGDAASTATAVGGLAADVRSGRVLVHQPAALVPQPEKVPAWTVALFNRGTPSFAVDCGGALHVSVLRSCTGWPSGVWIDPPRRLAPDGSAFELEHWSHIFDHALFVGRGDWRQAGCVEAAHAYNRSLRASLAPSHDGALPPQASLLSIEAGDVAANEAPGGDLSRPPGRVVLAALKPAGNPLASGDPAPTAMAPEGVEVTLRAYECTGRPVRVRVVTSAPLLRAEMADLLEQGRGGPLELVTGANGAAVAPLEMGAGEITTVRLSLGATVLGALVPGGPSGGHPAAPHLEAALPVFSRYWLHNKGPAPMGNQAVAAHVWPTAVAVGAGGTVEVTAQVASGSARATQAGSLEVVVPPGWAADPPSKLYSLAPGAYLRQEVHIAVPGTCRPGRYFAAVRTTDGAGQPQEDVVTVDVLPFLDGGAALSGEPGWAGPLGTGAGPAISPLRAPGATFGHPAGQRPIELEAEVEQRQLSLGPGGAGALGLVLANHTSGELRGEAQLVSPLRTWPLVGPWAQGFAVPAGATTRLEASVRAPDRGWNSSWALWKVTYFGRLWYSPAIALGLGQPYPARDGDGGAGG
jgi:alpha-mannosidase